MIRNILPKAEASFTEFAYSNEELASLARRVKVKHGPQEELTFELPKTNALLDISTYPVLVRIQRSGDCQKVTFSYPTIKKINYFALGILSVAYSYQHLISSPFQTLGVLLLLLLLFHGANYAAIVGTIDQSRKVLDNLVSSNHD